MGLSARKSYDYMIRKGSEIFLKNSWNLKLVWHEFQIDDHLEYMHYLICSKSYHQSETRAARV